MLPYPSTTISDSELDSYFTAAVWPLLQYATTNADAEAIIQSALEAITTALGTVKEGASSVDWSTWTDAQKELVKYKCDKWIDKWATDTNHGKGNSTASGVSSWSTKKKVVVGAIVGAAVLGLGYFLYSNYSEY